MLLCASHFYTGVVPGTHFPFFASGTLSGEELHRPLLGDAFTNSYKSTGTPSSVFLCTFILSVNTGYFYLLLTVKNLTHMLSLAVFDSPLPPFVLF